MDVEPFICLNMGTGTLEDALAWLEYCNGFADRLYGFRAISKPFLDLLIPTSPTFDARMDMRSRTISRCVASVYLWWKSDG